MSGVCAISTIGARVVANRRLFEGVCGECCCIVCVCDVCGGEDEI